MRRILNRLTAPLSRASIGGKPSELRAGTLSRVSRKSAPEPLGSDPLWYKDAVIYQLHVKAFADSSGDGIGDFIGLTGKLDYIASLGVTAIWVMPFYPSPLRDDGYDIADYTDVHPDYGTRADFRAFVRAAHKRGLRVITELVINHTSDQHPVVRRVARRRPTNPREDWYVWSPDDKKFADARIIFTDTETSNWAWDPTRQAYYWHRFFSHQPDLNYDNPAVLRAVVRVMRFWLEMGVDGLRLDAVPYLVEREGTNGENLPETHAVLKRDPRGDGREASRPDAPGRGEPVAGRGAALLRRRRRMQHGVPLPAHAAHLDRAAQGGSHPDRRHHGAAPRRSPTPPSGRSSCATTTS